MLIPDYQTVDKQAQDWLGSYDTNNDRGDESVRFALCSDQWMGNVLAERELSNKETLIFNTTAKFLKNFKAQIREIEFSIGLWARNDENNVSQTNTFRLLLNHLVLARHFVEKMEMAFDKSAEWGYSFLEINYDYDNDETLCLSPVIRFHEDPSIGFWDKAAKNPYRTDGRFSGLRIKVSKQEFLDNYPEYQEDSSWLKDSENDLIKYWYKVKESALFKALKGGVYKREDLITMDDELADESDIKDKKSGLYKKKLTKKGFKDCVYFMMFCNEHSLMEPKEFPSDRLPLPYHPAFTVWTKDGYETYPFSFSMLGIQQLINFVYSQLGTMVKNSTGDKWIFTPEHIPDEQAEKYAKNINQMEGAMVFPQDPQGAQIRREQPADIPYALMEWGQSLSQMANDISGAFFNPQNSENIIVSGKAMKEITENMNVVQVGSIACHVGFVNECAAIIKSMIPMLYTEERLLIARKADGTSEPIVINQPNGTGGLKNNIKDLSNSYIYELTSSPTSKMVKENTLKYLQMMYSIAPQLFKISGDMFARNLDIPDAQELELRIKAEMDPMLIKYSQSEISLQEYMKSKMPMQQQQQQQQQMQMQHAQLQMQELQSKNMKLKNEAQAVTMRAQGDMQKAQAAVQDSNVKAQVAITNASVAQGTLQVNAQKVMGEQQQRATQQALDESHLQYEREKHTYEVADGMIDHAINLHGITQNSISQQQQMNEPDNNQGMNNGDNSTAS